MFALLCSGSCLYKKNWKEKKSKFKKNKKTKQMCVNPQLKIAPFTYSWVTYAKNYSAQLFQEITQPSFNVQTKHLYIIFS